MKRKHQVALLLFATILGLFFIAIDINESKAITAIYIRTEGAIEPLTANITTTDNITYTFTDNNYGYLIIERDNIIVDGAEYTLQGSGGGTGIYLSGRNNVTLKDMNIEAFTNGVWLEVSSSNVNISGSQIIGNYIGIGLDDNSNNNGIFKNRIAGGYEGILLSGSSNYNSIAWNNISDNNYGIYIYSAHNNSIHHNNFIANTEQVYCYEATNHWNSSTEGNYWSDYMGSDANSDGIGETPYNIDESNQDKYPFVNVIPEFPSLLALLILMLATSLTTLVYKKKE